MIKKIIFFFTYLAMPILICVTHLLNAQDMDKVNDLVRQLKRAKVDTLKVKYLLDLYNEIRFSNPEQAFQYVQEAYTISEKNKYAQGMSNAARWIGLSYFYKSEFDSAKNYFLKSMKICEENKDPLGVAKAMFNLGNIEDAQGRNEKALELNLKCLSVVEKISDSLFLGRIYNNLGTILQKTGDYEKAIGYFFKSAEVKENIGDVKSISATYENIAVIYAHRKDYKGALNFNFKSLKICQDLGDNWGEANSYNNIGVNYYLQENNQKALESFLTSYRLFNELNNYEGISALCPYISNIYTMRKDYKNALKYVDLGLVLSKKIEASDKERDCYRQLADTYTEMKEYKKANDALNKFISLNDSIMDAEKNKTLVEMGTKYETEKKDNAILLLNKDKEIQSATIEKQRTARNYMWGGFGIFIVFSGISLYFYYQKKKSAFDVKVQEVEMTALRAQMNPHFIFNSLNSIHRYMQQKDHTNASDYLIKFSRLMRLILENSAFQEVSIEKDMTALDLYMQLESLRMDHKFKFEIKIDPQIDTENTLIPPLILQPFVENSIWHGLQHKTGTGKIKIEIKKDAEMICCSVEDDGVGRKKATEMKVKAPNHKGESLGMKITNSRIEIINKIKGTQSKVMLTDLDQGVRVELKLPFEMNF